MRDNRDIFVYIEIRATRLPRSTNFFLSNNVRLPTDPVLNRREIHGCQEEVREEVFLQEVVVEEVRIEEVCVQEVRQEVRQEGRIEEGVFEEGREQEGCEESVVEEGFGLFEESACEESFEESFEESCEEGSCEKSRSEEGSCEEGLVEEAQLLEEGRRAFQRTQRDQQSGQYREGHRVRHRPGGLERDARRRKQRRVELLRFEQLVERKRSAARHRRAAQLVIRAERAPQFRRVVDPRLKAVNGLLLKQFSMLAAGALASSPAGSAASRCRTGIPSNVAGKQHLRKPPIRRRDAAGPARRDAGVPAAHRLS
jgi:hypothetical protein